MAKYRARLQKIQAELHREKPEPGGAATSPAGAARFSAPRTAAFFVLSALLTVVLTGTGFTITRMAGDDFDDARRAGWASVNYCREHGPVSMRGFGYWHRCSVTVRWDDGDLQSLTSDGSFTSAEVDQNIRVGDLGRHRTRTIIAREDTPARPWFAWIGVPISLAAIMPGFFAFLIVADLLLRLRRRQ